MRQQLPTLTIAVCAFNEEANISQFLVSLLRQDLHGLNLKKILVVSDGSTDDTVIIVKKIQSEHPIITLIDSQTRGGKSSHLNTIYKNLSTDYLVQTDADVLFEDPLTIQKLLSPMLEDTTISMTCGNPIPAPAINFFEASHNILYMCLCETHKVIRGGENSFIADGRLLGYRKDFIASVTVPYDMIANDVFTYFACKSRNLKTRYVPGANVVFCGPKILKDKLRQNARSSAVRLRMERYFSKDLVDKEMHISIFTNIKSKFLQFSRAPLMSVLMYAINIYCRLRASHYDKELTAKWPMADTTKKFAALSGSMYLLLNI